MNYSIFQTILAIELKLIQFRNSFSNLRSKQDDIADTEVGETILSQLSSFSLSIFLILAIVLIYLLLKNIHKKDKRIKKLQNQVYKINTELNSKNYLNKVLCEKLAGRRKVENQIEHERLKAIQANEFKNNFLENLSHELRSPMNAINGFTTLIEKKKPKGETYNKYLSLIKNSSHQLLNVVSNLVDISKINTNQIEVKKRKFNLNQLLREQYIKLKQRLNEQNTNITPYFKPELRDEDAYIYTDSHILEQVFDKLIDNAVKFTSKGFIKIGYSIISLNEICFFIKDSGMGIEPKEKEHIFHSFENTNNYNQNFNSGIGLGLSISHGLVKHMDGNIWFESMTGKGSTFFFQIPVDHDIKLNTKLAHNSGQWSKRKFMLIDPNIQFYNELTEITKDFEPQLIYHHNAYDGIIECSQDLSIDLVFYIHLTDEDKEMVQRLKKIRHKLPVISLIHKDISAQTKDQLILISDDLFIQPINSKLLLQSVTKLLRTTESY